tara:strand:- start:16035 stop:18158 length:2124 start_codon:yes stop_codon:yes gene_type:complete
LKRLPIILVLLLCTKSTAAESQIVNGRVVDATTQRGIPNVNLYIPAQKIGSATDENGFFNLTFNSDKNVLLHISHIGYSNKTRVLNGKAKDLIIVLEETFFELEDVVVTSTRTEKIHRNVPVATEVISKKDIDDSGALNIAELLSSRSGVSLQTSVEGGSILNILGMDSRYILILIDGRPITGKFNNRVSLDQISTSMIKRVEIIKGPNSSLYGSEAMAGVVNIITKENVSNTSLNFSMRYDGTENKFKTEGLNHGSKSLRFGGQKTNGSFNLILSSDIEKIEMDKTVQQIDIDDINRQSIWGKLTWEMNENHSFSLSENFYNHGENGTSALMITSTDINRKNLSFEHNWIPINTWRWNHSFNYQTYSRNYVQTRPWGELVTDDITEEKNVIYEGMMKKTFGINDFNLGFEISHASYTSDRLESGKQFVSTNSIFGQYDMILGQKINAVMGYRIDKYTEHDLVISPRIGMMYSLNELWKFRATWGQGFRTPSFMERFIDWNHVQFGYQVLGNPDLKPERSNGYTIGAEYYHPNVYQVSLMMYFTMFENLIEDYAIEPALLSYHNIENAIYKGLEIQGRWLISSSWITSWGVNFIDNRNSKGDIIPNTQPLSGFSRFSYQSLRKFWGFSLRVKWTGSYTPEEYDLNSGGYIQAEQSLHDYVFIDLNGNLLIWNPITLSFGIKNAGDYTNDRYGPFVGRTFYFELSFKK